MYVCVCVLVIILRVRKCRHEQAFVRCVIVYLLVALLTKPLGVAAMHLHTYYGASRVYAPHHICMHLSLSNLPHNRFSIYIIPVLPNLDRFY